MKFSLFFEMQLSDPHRGGEAALFRECLEQALLAESLGYHRVWAVEHHGLFGYSHSSAPEIFLSFVAAKTRRIRVGHGVTLLPHRYNHPLRIAERIATLDILSEGRVDWGVGKSGSRVEQGAFQIDPGSIEGQWLEALSIIPRMWRDDLFSHRGEFFDIPPTRVIPKPLQSPHPPIFAACSNPESVEKVGRLGLGALNFAFGTDDYLLEKVRQYRAAVVTSSAPSPNDHFACTPATLVLPDDRQACAYGFRGARYFGSALGHYYFSPERPTEPPPLSLTLPSGDALDRLMKERHAVGSSISAVIGDPQAAREAVSRFQAVGVDELLLVMQMGTVPLDIVRQSIRTFAEQVMPHFG